MEAYSTTLVGAQDPDVKQCILLSSFSATSGRCERILRVRYMRQRANCRYSVCRTTTWLFSTGGKQTQQVNSQHLLEPNLPQMELYDRLTKDIPLSRRYAAEMLTESTFDDDRQSYIINLFFAFEIEVLCHTREWQRIRAVVEVRPTLFELFFTCLNNFERRQPPRWNVLRRQP